MGQFERLKTQAAGLRRQTLTLYLAARDPRTPWYAKALAAAVVAYALSPVDLVPDFIPVLGYLDDLVLVPAGVALFIRLVPPAVWAECAARSGDQSVDNRTGLIAAAVIVIAWVTVLAAVTRLIINHARRAP